jgi:hypothetical protein
VASALLPSRLRSLKLYLSSSSSSIRQSLVDALPSLPRLATLELGIDPSDLDLSPLLPLPQL